MNVKVKAWLTAPIAACVLCLTATDAEAQTQYATTAGTQEPPLHEQYLYRNPAQPSKDPRELKDSVLGVSLRSKYEPFRKCDVARERGELYSGRGVGEQWPIHVRHVASSHAGYRCTRVGRSAGTLRTTGLPRRGILVRSEPLSR